MLGDRSPALRSSIDLHRVKSSWERWYCSLLYHEHQLWNLNWCRVALPLQHLGMVQGYAAGENKIKPLRHRTPTVGCKPEKRFEIHLPCSICTKSSGRLYIYALFGIFPPTFVGCSHLQSSFCDSIIPTNQTDESDLIPLLGRLSKIAGTTMLRARVSSASFAV